MMKNLKIILGLLLLNIAVCFGAGFSRADVYDANDEPSNKARVELTETSFNEGQTATFWVHLDSAYEIAKIQTIYNVSYTQLTTPVDSARRNGEFAKKYSFTMPGSNVTLKIWVRQITKTVLQAPDDGSTGYNFNFNCSENNSAGASVKCAVGSNVSFDYQCPEETIRNTPWVILGKDTIKTEFSDEKWNFSIPRLPGDSVFVESRCTPNKYNVTCGNISQMNGSDYCPSTTAKVGTVYKIKSIIQPGGSSNYFGIKSAYYTVENDETHHALEWNADDDTWQFTMPNGNVNVHVENISPVYKVNFADDVMSVQIPQKWSLNFATTLDTIHFSLKPGVKIGGVRVVTEDGRSWPVEEKDGDYMFAMPSGNATIETLGEDEHWVSCHSGYIIEPSDYCPAASAKEGDIYKINTVIQPEGSTRYYGVKSAYYLKKNDTTHHALVWNADEKTLQFKMPPGPVDVYIDSYSIVYQLDFADGVDAVRISQNWPSNFAANGDTVHFSFKSDVKIGEVVVGAVNGNMAQVWEDDDGYTFVMPNNNVSISNLVDDGTMYKFIVQGEHVKCTVYDSTGTSKMLAAKAGDKVMIKWTVDEGYSLRTYGVRRRSYDNGWLSFERNGYLDKTNENYAVVRMPVDDVVLYFDARPAYKIKTVYDSTMGKISVQDTLSLPGNSVSVLVEPTEAYALDSVYVIRKNDDPSTGDDTLDVELRYNGKWYFVMPDGDVTVTATFKKLSKFNITYSIPEWVDTIYTKPEIGYAGKEVYIGLRTIYGYNLAYMIVTPEGGEPDTVHNNFIMPASDINVSFGFTRIYGIFVHWIPQVKNFDFHIYPDSTDSINAIHSTKVKLEEGGESGVHIEPISGYIVKKVWLSNYNDSTQIAPDSLLQCSESNKFPEGVFCSITMPDYDIMINAEFEQITKQITFVYGDSTIKKLVGVGDIPVAPKEFCPEDTKEYTYTCTWDKKFAAVESETTYTLKKVEKAKVKYTIKVSVNDKSMGAVTGLSETGVYEYGTEVKLTAKAKSGYEFSNWNDDVKKAERTIKVTGDATFKATFKAKAKSSSSSAKAKSSSSKKKDAIFASVQVPMFSVSTLARDILVSGANVGSAYSVFDMQGRLMEQGRVESANFSLTMPRAGSYVLRIDGQTQRVALR